MTGSPRELFVFTANWCPHCRAMKHAQIVAKLRRQISIPVTVVDLTKGMTPVASLYGVKLIPSFVLVDLADGRVVGRSTGPKTVEQLVRLTQG